MKLGLVLGSGAARGWAHIGIINRLKEIGFEPHIVTGSSIGALVGAALASGKLAELQEWVKSLDNWQVFSLLDWGLGQGGLISGEKVFEKVTETIGDVNFEDLNLPFGAVATDLFTGRETWLTQGSLKHALRCSCAIPGILAPYEYEGRWMVDGATVNPVPVSLCKAMGADFVIAVDLNSDKSNLGAKNQEKVLPQAEAEELPSEPEKPLDYVAKPGSDRNHFDKLLLSGKNYLQQLKERKQVKARTPDVFAVMSGCIDIMQDRITRSQLAGDPPDLVIQPKLSDYGIMDFDKAEALIKIGEECVDLYRPILQYKLEHISV
ncbi:patatin-like phospholipase RssA [Planctobacterium marinum]|uniref:patatin-like phospholipase RssA n=1 Tax=Planctobacterium marinum TaxID=1631968 RepID=UPI001E5D379D|nr:patatin-like phospholipase RssA [Planctobacterium marinum]MCC2607118.1 patatin-like phospholipase RssA [Planctobacterium marinum]